MLESAENWKSTLNRELRVLRHEETFATTNRAIGFMLTQHSLPQIYERFLSEWTKRRSLIANTLLPRAKSILEIWSDIGFHPDYTRLSDFGERVEVEIVIMRLIELLKIELDKRSVVICDTRQKLADYTAERLAVVRISHAVHDKRVGCVRGSDWSNDDVILRLDNGNCDNYCITPEPICYDDWDLVVARCKLLLMKLCRTNMICNDLLSVICLRLDDVFHMRTTEARALISVRDFDWFDAGKCWQMSEPPGIQVRRHLFSLT